MLVHSFVLYLDVARGQTNRPRIHLEIPAADHDDDEVQFV